MRQVLNFVALLALCLVVIGCQEDTSAAAQADKANKRAQMDVKARATAAVPVPHTSTFQARRNLAEFMRRTDE